MQPSRVTLAPAAIIVAFAVPLLVSRHTLPLATFYGEWAAGLLGVLLVLVLVASRAPRDPSQQIRIVPLIALAPLWLIGTTLLQAASGVADITGSRLMTDVMLASGGAVMAAAWWTGQGMSAAQRETMVDALAAAFLIAGLLGTLAQWVQVFHMERHTFGLVSEYFHADNRRLWGNLNQPNHQATVEGLALAASVWLAMRGKLRFPAWLVAVLLVESGIVLSGSRTGVVHVGIAVVYALLAATMARGERSPNLMRRPATLVVTAAIMAVMFMALMTLIKTAGLAFDWRLFDAVAQMHTKDQLSGRNALWAHAIGMFRAHPWLGVGYGEFGWAQFQQLAQVGGRPEMALHAHNAVLDLLAKTGAIGTVGVLVMLAAWLWRVVRQRLLHGERADRWQTVVVLVWLAMFAAHSMLEYPLHYLYFFLPFCFLLGWLETAGIGGVRSGRPAVAMAAIGTIAAALVLVTTWQDYRRVEARQYAAGSTREALPMPTFWFGAYARMQSADDAIITADNAPLLLPAQIESVHLLPTPAIIARAAWLFALTGEPERGRLWMERLRFYYQGDERAQFAAIEQACQTIDADRRPRDFCTWIRAKSRSMTR
ncbi:MULTISPECIES: PglL family O-oligosaccharyltransferase [unclassified Cupriavidus]|uniref:PglL family O-oligosaccharyltransferase n=1 Tax=Cupriavidus sp. H19C3 TaxID=3241603 RepID=UPI003BF8F7BA